MQQYVEQLLTVALDTELREFDFWEMTIAEILRHIDSYNRRYKLQAQERASYDYILASLIVRGVSITLGSKDTFPPIHEVYGSLFKEESQKQQQKAEENKIMLSVLRFKQFAQSYNKKFENNKGVSKSE